MSGEVRRRVMTPAEAGELFPALLSGGGTLPVAVTGRSMLPFLREGRDTVWLTAPDRPIKRGDIVFFRRVDGSWVLHRVRQLTDQGLIVNGDAQMWDEPVAHERVVAVVTSVERHGRRRDEHRFCHRVAVAVWRAMRPIRPYCLRVIYRWYRIRDRFGRA